MGIALEADPRDQAILARHEEGSEGSAIDVRLECVEADPEGTLVRAHLPQVTEIESATWFG